MLIIKYHIIMPISHAVKHGTEAGPFERSSWGYRSNKKRRPLLFFEI